MYKTNKLSGWDSAAMGVLATGAIAAWGLAIFKVCPAMMEAAVNLLNQVNF
jgi:hypothetical protein